MKHKIKTNTLKNAIVSASIMLGFAVAAFSGINVNAKNNQPTDKDFNTSVETVANSDSEVHELSVEVYNQGKDFEGTVRVIIDGDTDWAYDTQIVLPEKSTKTFSVKIPADCIMDYRDRVKVQIISNKGVIIKNDTFNNALSDVSASTLLVGVLSDNYNNLTYLDMGGDELYYITDNYTIELEELDKNNATYNLSNYAYYVIDDYDTSALSNQQIAELEAWVKNGGKLIIGTGKNYDNGFAGFEPDFIDVTFNSTNLTKEDIFYGTDDVDCASITVGNGYYIADDHFCLKTTGSGSIEIVDFLIGDPSLRNAYDSSRLAEQLFTESLNGSNYVTGNSGNYMSPYNFERAMDALQGKQGFSTLAINLIIIFYVVLIGPITYVILLKMKKREYCWVVIPGLAFLFVGIIFLVGRSGIKINQAMGYSVTLVNTDGSKYSDTFVAAYKSEGAEWELKTAPNVKYIGTPTDAYNYSNSADYTYRVANNGVDTRIGYIPDGNFDSGYFRMLIDGKNEGTIKTEQVSFFSGYQGTVTNNTNKDFKYMLVADNGYYVVIKDVKAGESVKISAATIETSNSFSDPDTFMYREVEDSYYDKEYERAKYMGAMYVALSKIYEENTIITIGVTDNYDTVLDDNLKEESYGCFYKKEIY